MERMWKGNLLRRLAESLLKLVYPPRCPSCGALLGEYEFCEECLRGVRFVSAPCCEICGKPFDPMAKSRETCADCANSRPQFVKARAAVLYEGPVAEAIKGLKYKGRTSAVRSLAPLLVRAILSLDIPLKGHLLLVPVPLHPRRMAERGFNQSELLAKEAARALGVEVERRALIRKVNTRPQVELPGRERMKNVKGAFEVKRPERVRGRVVIVVDDVMTTGATLCECAKALRKAKVEEVYAAVVAREVEMF